MSGPADPQSVAVPVDNARSLDNSCSLDNARSLADALGQPLAAVLSATALTPACARPGGGAG